MYKTRPSKPAAPELLNFLSNWNGSATYPVTRANQPWIYCAQMMLCVPLTSFHMCSSASLLHLVTFIISLRSYCIRLPTGLATSGPSSSSIPPLTWHPDPSYLSKLPLVSLFPSSKCYWELDLKNCVVLTWPGSHMVSSDLDTNTNFY